MNTKPIRLWELQEPDRAKELWNQAEDFRKQAEHLLKEREELISSSYVKQFYAIVGKRSIFQKYGNRLYEVEVLSIVEYTLQIRRLKTEKIVSAHIWDIVFEDGTRVFA